MAAGRRRTWGSIVIGIAVVCGVLAAVAGISLAVFFHRHVVTEQHVSAETARQEFDRTRAGFAGQQPLIEYGDLLRDDPVVHRSPDAPRRGLARLRVLTYESD